MANKQDMMKAVFDDVIYAENKNEKENGALKIQLKIEESRHGKIRRVQARVAVGPPGPPAPAARPRAAKKSYPAHAPVRPGTYS